MGNPKTYHHKIQSVTMTNNTPGPERFAIVEIPAEGPSPANSLLIGPLDMLMEQIPDTKARIAAEQRLADAQINAAQVQKMQDATRGIQVAAFCDGVTRLAHRLDGYEQRQAARERADQEQHELEEAQRKAEQIQLALDALEEPSETHHPAADLHSVDPSEPQREEQLQQSMGDAGGVPLSYGNVPMSYERRKAEDQGDLPRELTEKVPPDPGTEPALSGSSPSTARNPVGISW
jgi:hypothetical protein